MANYGEGGDKQNIGGSDFMGGGGMFAMIILVVVVLWVLFSRDGHKDGYAPYAAGYGAFGGCGPCVQPTFKDESNFEEERNINAKLCKVDEDIWKTSCQTQKEVAAGDNAILSKMDERYIQDLRDKNTEKDMIIQTMKSEAFTEKKFDQLERMNERRFDQITAAIGILQCEIPKRPPVFAECVTPNTHDIDCREDFRPRRGRCGGCDDGFGFGYVA